MDFAASSKKEGKEKNRQRWAVVASVKQARGTSGMFRPQMTGILSKRTFCSSESLGLYLRDSSPTYLLYGHYKTTALIQLHIRWTNTVRFFTDRYLKKNPETAPVLHSSVKTAGS